jgi:hypothetical protein
LLAFVLARFQFRFSRPTIARIVSGLLPLVIVVAIAFGGLEARAMHTDDLASVQRLAFWRGIVFGLPYALLAAWILPRLLQDIRQRRAKTI